MAKNDTYQVQDEENSKWLEEKRVKRQATSAAAAVGGIAAILVELLDVAHLVGSLIRALGL